MRKGLKKKVISLLMASVVAISSFSTIVLHNPVEVSAAKKAYGDKLTLNNDIKVNKTTTFTRIGLWKEGDERDGRGALYPVEQKGKVKYTIKCKKKSSGKNYKVTYTVNYKFIDDPQAESVDGYYEDWYWGFKHPQVIYTVFDYQTGKSLEVENDLGVKVKRGERKNDFYPEQSVPTLEDPTAWYRNYKTVSYSFTVTYPKDCKDVVVGIGFANCDSLGVMRPDGVDNRYWNGEVPYGKTSYYKGGKKTMSYMRLK